MHNLPLLSRKENTPSINRKTSRSSALLKNIRKRKLLYLMAIPGIIYYVLFRYVPMYGVIVAFKNYSPYDGFWAIWTSKFVGFRWFEILFRQSDFWMLMRNTVTISLYMIIFGFPAPIILALMLNEVKNDLFKRCTQTITYIPHFLSWAIVGGIISQILSPNGGVVNSILGFFNIPPKYFLIEKEYFRAILVGADIWKEVGWNSIIFMAAISGIDTTLYEAAIVDGASKWKQVIYITLPSILPLITVLLILSIGRIMDTGFDAIYMLYSPKVYEVADVFSTYSYRVGIGRGQFSYVTALGLFQNVVNLILLLFANKMSKIITQNSLW